VAREGQKNLKVVVVRKCEGNRMKMGEHTKSAYENTLNAYSHHDEGGKPQMMNRSQSTNSNPQAKQYILTRKPNKGNQFVALDKPSDNSLIDSYAQDGNQGKRANSTQSDQMKRSKINASQLFDNSFLCCLTQTKQKKDTRGLFRQIK